MQEHKKNLGEKKKVHTRFPKEHNSSLVIESKEKELYKTPEKKYKNNDLKEAQKDIREYRQTIQ